MCGKAVVYAGYAAAAVPSALRSAMLPVLNAMPCLLRSHKPPWARFQARVATHRMVCCDRGLDVACGEAQRHSMLAAKASSRWRLGSRFVVAPAMAAHLLTS